MLGADPEFRVTPPHSLHVERAWELYCRETRGSLDWRDYWVQLSPEAQQHYLERTRHGP